MPDELKWGEYYIDQRTGQPIRYCPLHLGQQAIIDSKARFLFFIVGKGGGKSSFAPSWLLEEIRKAPLGKFAIVSDSYARIEQGVLPEFKKAMEYSEFGGPWNEHWRQGRHIYQLSSGGTVFVRSLDDEEAINGLHLDAICCDEGLLLGRSAWDILESRVHLRKGRILVTSTPYKHKSRWAVDIIDLANNGDPNYFVYQAGSVINPAVDADEIERQRQRLPKWRFEQDYLGLFTIPEGTIYPTMRDCLVDPAQLPEGKVIGGVDLGHGGAPSCAVAGVLDKENTLHIFYELYHKPEGQESSYLSFARALKAWHNTFYAKTNRVVERWFCDSATDTWKALRRYRMANDEGPSLNARPAKKGSGSVEFGIDLVTARIQTGKLKLLRGCVSAIIQESEEYRYDVDEDNPSSSVIKGSDHALDALRYLCLSIDRKRALIDA